MGRFPDWCAVTALVAAACSGTQFSSGGQSGAANGGAAGANQNPVDAWGGARERRFYNGDECASACAAAGWNRWSLATGFCVCEGALCSSVAPWTSAGEFTACPIGMECEMGHCTARGALSGCVANSIVTNLCRVYCVPGEDACDCQDTGGNGVGSCSCDCTCADGLPTCQSDGQCTCEGSAIHCGGSICAPSGLAGACCRSDGTCGLLSATFPPRCN